MKKPVPPCKGCESRAVGCRNSCGAWIAYEYQKSEYQKAYSEYAKGMRDAEHIAIDRAINQKKRYKK